MERDDVERIVRNVFNDLAAPFTLLSVQRTARGWEVMVKQTLGRRVHRVSTPDGPPPAIRTAIMQLVEAESD